METYYQLYLDGYHKEIRIFFNDNFSIGEVLSDGYMINTFNPNKWIELLEANQSGIKLLQIAIKVHNKYPIPISLKLNK